MPNTYETKLWGGRFRGDEDALMQHFNSECWRTSWLVEPDIQGSLAHVAMQVKCGLLTSAEGEALTRGLETILADFKAGQLVYTEEYEDVHTFVELHLIRRVGDVGKKLHTARSRNDQCNVDMKLYVKQQAHHVAALIDTFCATLQRVAEENPWMMPGYTHLQRAQVVTFKYHLMAYCEMMLRDKKRLLNAVDVMDESPLGCGALAGTTHIIDRSYTAQLLGFSHGACKNFLDGVSDRDFVLEVLSDFSILMMHLSRLAEELILWNSAEFGFVVLDDKYTTGSSIMPQKKNPDGAELVRGSDGLVVCDEGSASGLQQGHAAGQGLLCRCAGRGNSFIDDDGAHDRYAAGKARGHGGRGKKGLSECHGSGGLSGAARRSLPRRSRHRGTDRYLL